MPPLKPAAVAAILAKGPPPGSLIPLPPGGLPSKLPSLANLKLPGMPGTAVPSLPSAPAPASLGAGNSEEAIMKELMKNKPSEEMLASNPTIAAMYAQLDARWKVIEDAKWHEPSIHPDVQELADHFRFDQKLTNKLNWVLSERKDTFMEDIYGLWDNLRNAHTPGAMCTSKIKEMINGTWVGKPRPDSDVQALVKKFKLDDQAATKLAGVLNKQGQNEKVQGAYVKLGPEGKQVLRSQLLTQLDKRLECSNQPSAMVMMLLKKLAIGEELGAPPKGPSPGSFLDLKNKAEAEKSRPKSRSRSRANAGRYRSRSRGGGGGGGGRSGRSRSRGQRGRSRDRPRGGSRDRPRGGSFGGGGGG